MCPNLQVTLNQPSDIRDITRIERIGAHSHIRGLGLDDALEPRPVRVSPLCVLIVCVCVCACVLIVCVCVCVCVLIVCVCVCVCVCVLIVCVGISRHGRARSC